MSPCQIDQKSPQRSFSQQVVGFWWWKLIMLCLLSSGFQTGSQAPHPLELLVGLRAGGLGFPGRPHGGHPRAGAQGSECV